MILYIISQRSLPAAWVCSLPSEFSSFSHWEHLIFLQAFPFLPLFYFSIAACCFWSPPLDFLPFSLLCPSQFLPRTSFPQSEELEKAFSRQEGFPFPRNQFYGLASKATAGLPVTQTDTALFLKPASCICVISYHSCYIYPYSSVQDGNLPGKPGSRGLCKSLGHPPHCELSALTQLGFSPSCSISALTA